MFKLYKIIVFGQYVVEEMDFIRNYVFNRLVKKSVEKVYKKKKKKRLSSIVDDRQSKKKEGSLW